MGVEGVKVCKAKDRPVKPVPPVRPATNPDKCHTCDVTSVRMCMEGDRSMPVDTHSPEAASGARSDSLPPE